MGPLNEMRNTIWTMFQWPDFRDQNVCTLMQVLIIKVAVFPLTCYFLVTFPARDVSLYGFLNPSWWLKELTHLVVFMLFYCTPCRVEYHAQWYYYPIWWRWKGDRRGVRPILFQWGCWESSGETQNEDRPSVRSYVMVPYLCYVKVVNFLD